MSVPAKHWALAQTVEGGSSARIILFFLADWVIGEDQVECWPTVDVLAFETGMNRQTIMKATANLEKQGLIEKQFEWLREDGSLKKRVLYRLRGYVPSEWVGSKRPDSTKSRTNRISNVQDFERTENRITDGTKNHTIDGTKFRTTDGTKFRTVTGNNRDIQGKTGTVVAPATNSAVVDATPRNGDTPPNGGTPSNGGATPKNGGRQPSNGVATTSADDIPAWLDAAPCSEPDPYLAAETPPEPFYDPEPIEAAEPPAVTTVTAEPKTTPQEPTLFPGDDAEAQQPTEAKPEKKPRKKAATKAKADRGTRLKIETLPDEWRKWIEENAPDIEPDAFFADWHDYWIGVSGAKGTKLDWFATFRNGVRGMPDWKRRNFLKRKSAQRQALNSNPRDWERTKPQEERDYDVSFWC